MIALHKKRVCRGTLLIFLFICLLFSGCNNTPPNDKKTPDESDIYTYEQPYEMIWAYLDYSSEKLAVSEDLDVNLCFEFTSHYDLCSDCKTKYVIQIRGFDDKFNAIDENNVVVKNGYFSRDLYESYDFGGVSIECAIERITVPSDWFSSDVGAINFRIYIEELCNHQDFPLETSNGVSLYYRKDGSTVKLFRSRAEAL